MERGAILWTNHEMGLQEGQESAHLDAWVCSQSPHPFLSSPPVKIQDQPYPHLKPNYGAKTQHATAEDTSPPLNKAGKKFIQEVCGVFLFLARGVDSGILPALSALASQQANPTERTMALCKQFFDYMAWHAKAVLTYKASNMVLAVHSNASYLSKRKALSRAGGNTSEVASCPLLH